LLLGGFGINKFYLGRIGQGILYLIFCWTFIPTLVGFVEGIIYLTMSDQVFEARYG
jgi:TM2 domain-containing membrane protein YozV